MCVACGSNAPAQSTAPTNSEPAQAEPAAQTTPADKPADPPATPAAAPVPPSPPTIASLPTGWKRINVDGYDLLRYELSKVKNAAIDLQIQEVENKPIVVGEAGPPMEPEKYGEWIAKVYKDDVAKKEKIGEAYAFDYKHREAGSVDKQFAVYVKVGDKLWKCHGRDASVHALPDGSPDEVKLGKAGAKEVAAAIAEGKKLCATMK